jgi:hypothetical protein
MKLKSARFVLVAISFLFASVLSAQHVKTHYDRCANFAQYKTYSWEQVKTREPLDVDRIKSAVNAALAAKGWTRVESGGDVWIVAIEGIRRFRPDDGHLRGPHIDCRPGRHENEKTPVEREFHRQALQQL